MANYVCMYVITLYSNCTAGSTVMFKDKLIFSVFQLHRFSEIKYHKTVILRPDIVQKEMEQYLLCTFLLKNLAE